MALLFTWFGSNDNLFSSYSSCNANVAISSICFSLQYILLFPLNEFLSIKFFFAKEWYDWKTAIPQELIFLRLLTSFSSCSTLCRQFGPRSGSTKIKCFCKMVVLTTDPSKERHHTVAPVLPCASDCDSLAQRARSLHSDRAAVLWHSQDK